MTHLLVIATGNAHKVTELRELFSGLPLRLVTPRDLLGSDIEVDEDGATLEENALKKASVIAKATMAMTLADDSGLEVDALGGAPGVHSRRYAHSLATDAENNAHLLSQLKMAEASSEDCAARFRCVLALVDPYAKPGSEHGTLPYFSQGTCEGRIANTPRGKNGFGYDPLFIVDGGDRTMAELSEAEKNAISHRARAAQTMKLHLEALLKSRS
jgi:XTP/dITP diphosphohydrolase